MNVVAWSRSLTQEKADALDIGFVSNIVNLAKMSDVISINVAGNADTKNLIGEQFCNALKPGAYVINTSRGSVIDQAALTQAIRTKGVRCGLDVFANEPPGGQGDFGLVETFREANPEVHASIRPREAGGRGVGQQGAGQNLAASIEGFGQVP